MKILIINLDKSIFMPDSRSLANLKDYSRFFEKLFVITWTLKNEKPIFFENRLFIYPTNSYSRLFYTRDTRKIFKKFLKKENINLVSSQDPFETGFAAFLISRIFKIPLHLQIHTDFLSPYFWNESLLNKIRVILAKFLIPRANCVRVVSKRIAESLKAISYKLKADVNVLPIYVDIEEIKKTTITESLRDKYPQFDFIMLIASRLSKEKNIGLAIEALYDINLRMRASNTNNANKKNIGLIIVGDGPERKALKFQVSSFKFQENVVFEDWVNQETLISYYKTADLFLLTSNYEGYGMTVVEAMAAGCPVLMTDVGVANEILINKKDGFVVPVGNKQELTKALLALIANRELRKSFIVNSEKTINFWPSYVEYLKKYYNSWISCLNK